MSNATVNPVDTKYLKETGLIALDKIDRFVDDAITTWAENIRLTLESIDPFDTSDAFCSMSKYIVIANYLDQIINYLNE